MIESTIYCYGSGEYLVQVFNAIARICQHSIVDTIIKAGGTIGLAYTVTMALYSGARNLITPVLRQLVLFTILTSVFILPKQDILIRDVVTNYNQKVSNIPFGLALPASLISFIGYNLTQAFEMEFSSVDNLQYHKYGMVFGSQMIDNARNIKIRSGKLNENIHNFMDRCVVTEALKGTNYTVSDLKTTNDMWSLIRDNASGFYRVIYRDPDGSTDSISCREAASRIEKSWIENIDKSITRYASTIFAKAGSSSNEKDLQSLSRNFKKNFKTAIGGIIPSASEQSANDILRQQLMINALSDFKISSAGVRAAQQQNRSMVVTGELTRQNLPIMAEIIGVIIYSAFILIIPILFGPSALKTLGAYFGLLCWIQLWAPLNAVLNMVMTLGSKVHGYFVGAEGMTYENMLAISSVHSDIAAMAGYFTASIPFISYAIVKGGAGSFMHLANSLGSATQSAASGAAAEAASGNYSFDNVSYDNMQWSNRSGFNNDTTLRQRGGSERQLMDGTIEKIMPSGNAIHQSGAGITSSSGQSTVRVSDAMSENISQQKSENESVIESLSNSAQEQRRDLTSDLQSFAKNHGVNVSKGEIDDAITSWGVGGSVNGSINSKSLPLSFMKKIVGEKVASKIAGANLGASIHGNGNYTISSTSQSRTDKNSNDGILEQLGKSYERLHSTEEQLAARQEKAASLNKAESLIKSNAINYDQDTYQPFKEYIQKNADVNDLEAQRMIDNGGAQRYLEGFASENVNKLVSEDNFDLDAKYNGASQNVNAKSNQNNKDYKIYSQEKVNRFRSKVSEASEQQLISEKPKGTSSEVLGFGWKK